jgi:hypothetical protein
MPLHLTKIAFQSEGPDSLRAWLESHAPGEAKLTTRYVPKRLAELEGGSLYWVYQHRLIGRSPILGFSETGQGRWWIRLEPRLIPVRAAPKRAHQGWRYLADADAPADLDAGEADDLDAMPPAMLGELAKLGLV